MWPRGARRPARIVSDKGYSSGQARRMVRRRHIGPVIPPRSDERPRPDFDRAPYRERNAVEIVSTQMRKAQVLTGGRGGEDRADRDHAVGDEHPVNEHLDELARRRKGGLGEPGRHRLAEVLH
jgi:hypothetical protein